MIRSRSRGRSKGIFKISPILAAGPLGGDEVCSMAIVTGWRVEVSDKLQTWFYRTDRQGKTIRLESPQRTKPANR
jgi:hypothetical protein